MDIIGIANYVQQQGELGRQQGTTQRLNRLAGQAYGAPDAQQRNGYLQQMVATDPQAGIEMQNTMQGQDDRRARQAANVAKSMLAAVESKNPAMIEGAWRAVRPFLQQMVPDREVPEAWAPELEAGLHQAIAAGGEAGAGVNVQSTYIDQQGNRVAIMRDGTQRLLGKAENRMQSDDWGDRKLVFNPRTGTYSEPSMAGAPMAVEGQQAYQSPGAASRIPGQVTTSTGEVIDITGMPQEVQAYAQSNPDRFAANLASGEGFDIPAQSTPAGSAPLRKGLSPQQQVQQAQQVEQRAIDDQRWQVTNGRAESTERRAEEQWQLQQQQAKQKAAQLPPNALRLDFDIQDAIAANKTSAGILVKHANRLANGELKITPVAYAMALVRSKAGQATQNDVNIIELRSDLTKYVNESLRLNNGVQTEGDAQRAFNEIMNSNDQAVVTRGLQRLANFVRDASNAQARKRETLYRNYGVGLQQQPREQSGNVLRYNPATGDFD